MDRAQMPFQCLECFRLVWSCCGLLVPFLQLLLLQPKEQDEQTWRQMRHHQVAGEEVSKFGVALASVRFEPEQHIPHFPKECK